MGIAKLIYSLAVLYPYIAHGYFDHKASWLEADAQITMDVVCMRRILFISPLPPPHGGIATWTEKVLQYGLPDASKLVLVNTRIQGKRNIFDKKYFFLHELSRTIRIFSLLIYQLVKNRPKLIHLNCSLSSVGIFRDLACAGLANLFRIPIVTHYHGNLPDFNNKRFYGLSRIGLRLLMRVTNINIMTNQRSLEAATLIYSNDKETGTILLPNFIEDAIFENQRVAEKNFKLSALYAGGITKAKGCIEILEVARQMPEIEFHLFGEMHNDMVIYFKNIPKNVHLHGAQPHDIILNAMSRCDFLLFPSHTEGFPLTVLEAMSMGLPVIATSVGAIPEMIEEGRGGFLVEPGDVDNLKLTINKLAVDAELRKMMGHFNKEKSYTQYRYSIVIEKLLKIYNDLCGLQPCVE